MMQRPIRVVGFFSTQPNVLALRLRSFVRKLGVARKMV